MKGQRLKVGVRSGSPGSGGSGNSLVFKYLHNIIGTVGKGGTNLANDVIVIQKRLKALGFLSEMAFNIEKPSSGTGRVGDMRLSQTFAAIERFQQEVMGADQPDDLIKPEAHSLMFLNTATPPPTADKITAIDHARSQFHLKQTDGSKTLSGGIKGPVGDYSFDNYPEDVKKIQQRLVETGFLSASHGETPTGNAKVTPRSLRRTIDALKRFQKYKVEWWLKYPHIIGNVIFTRGIVKINDLTYQILKKFTEYHLTFPAPNDVTQRKFAEFNNYPKSSATIDIDGISYVGGASPKHLPLSEFKKLGLNHVEARALQYVSEHEGNFDAINSYDKAIFSYGFIQFAGGTGGLAPMLALLKYRKTDTFRKYFQNNGLDVEYTILFDDIKKAHLVAIDTANGKVLRRTAAETYLKKNIGLYGAFIRAAYDRNVQLMQIESAKIKYVGPALRIKLDFFIPVIYVLDTDRRSPVKTFVGTNANQYKQTTEFQVRNNAGRIQETQLVLNKTPITDIIRSEMGITVLIDLTVNQWVNVTRDQFTNAIHKVAAADSLDTLAKLKKISDWKVLHQIVKDAVPIASIRTRNIMENSGLSTVK